MRTNPLPPPESGDAMSPGERLSSLVDGDCPAGALDEACRRWREDTTLQRDWQLYHLIGDVLRSDELSPQRRADAAFLCTLRERMAREPVPLAPAALPATPSAARPSWASAALRRWPPPALAAGLAGVAVLGSAVMLMQPDPPQPAVGWGEQGVMVLPASPRAAGLVSHPVAAAPGASGQAAFVRQQQRLRDARLDAYFEAHRGALPSMPVATPGAWPRESDFVAPPQ